MVHCASVVQVTQVPGEPEHMLVPPLQTGPVPHPHARSSQLLAAVALQPPLAQAVHCVVDVLIHAGGSLQHNWSGPQPPWSVGSHDVHCPLRVPLVAHTPVPETSASQRVSAFVTPLASQATHKLPWQSGVAASPQSSSLSQRTHCPGLLAAVVGAHTGVAPEQSADTHARQVLPMSSQIGLFEFATQPALLAPVVGSQAAHSPFIKH